MNNNVNGQMAVDIIGYEGLYTIDNYGNIYSKRCKLKPKVDKDGYLEVTLHKNGKPKWFRVHRLVAQAFIPNPENKSQVNHIDGNKRNNNVSNLEWVTNKENIDHAIKIGLQTPYGDTNPNSKAVVQLDINGNILNIFKCIKYASDTTGVYQTGIGRVCAGKRHTAGGYKWEFYERGDYNKH